MAFNLTPMGQNFGSSFGVKGVEELTQDTAAEPISALRKMMLDLRKASGSSGDDDSDPLAALLQQGQ
jgi:hypothetical protein